MSEPCTDLGAELPSFSSSEFGFLKDIYQETCVFCQSQEGQRKVLRCLHVAFKPCISEHLSGQNTLTCVRCHKDTPDPGPGRTLVNSLVDWPRLEAVSEPAASDQPALCQHSDDDGTTATGRCGECDLLLCASHSFVHGLSKKTRGHAVLPLKSAKRRSDDCQLHPANRVTTFCHTCDVWLCEKCMTKSEHVLHNSEASASYCETVSEDLKMKLQLVTERRDIVAEEEEVNAQLIAVNDGTQSLSDDITRIFDSAHETLKKREEKLKDTLDKKRGERLEILERRRESAQETRRQLLVSTHLLKALEGNDLAQVSYAIKNISGQTTKELHQPPIVLGGSINGLDDKSGSVACAMDCILHFEDPVIPQPTEPFDCSSHAYCDMFDPTQKSAGAILSNQNRVVTACPKSQCVPVEGDDSDDYEFQTVCSAGYFTSGAVYFELVLQSLCRSDQQADNSHSDHGDPHHNTDDDGSSKIANGQDNNLAGFDSDDMIDHLEEDLLDRIRVPNSHATSGTARDDGTAVSVDDAAVEDDDSTEDDEEDDGTDVTDATEDDEEDDTDTDQPCCSMIGVSVPGAHQSISTVFHMKKEKQMCWAGSKSNLHLVLGGKLGQPWRRDDIIRLKLDCDAHKMTAVHVRSGDRQTLDMPAGPVCLAVVLLYDDSVRLMVPKVLI